LKISSISWDNVVVPDHASVSYICIVIFIAIFSKVYDEYFPVITKRVKLINCKYKPWNMTAILKSIRCKNLLYKIG